MTAAFDLALDAAFHSLQMTRGKSASYKVSNATTISDITIVPAETTRDEIGSEGVVISKRSQDWLIKVSDLSGNEPNRSHEITVGSETFKLIDLDGEKAFRFHNPPSNSVYRVHTVLTSGSPG